MTEFEIFLFGILNFVALIIALMWGLRRIARQYFYARSVGLRKEMIKSAHERRDAKARLVTARRKFEGVDGDIEHRRETIVSGYKKEGTTILEEAALRALRIIETTTRQAQEVRARAIAKIRAHILTHAFEKARTMLERGISESDEQHLVGKSLADLESIAKRDWAPLSKISNGGVS